MNSRSKKYYEKRKANKEDKDNSHSKSIPAEQTTYAMKQPKENSATQDDTGGGNDSGKRSDEN